MSNCTGGAWYPSTVNVATSSEVACTNDAKPGQDCKGAVCTTQIPSSQSGFCLCSDSTLRYVSSPHDVTRCSDQCASPAKEFDSVWDSSYEKCSSTGDCKRKKGREMTTVVIIVFSCLVLLLLLLLLTSPPTKGKLSQLDSLQERLRQG